MSFAFTSVPKEQIKIPGEQHVGQMTPFFMYLNVKNEQKSKAENRAVYDMIEAVQLRLPGDRHYSPVLPADSMWYMDEENERIITYAERFADQYRAFLANEEQVAEGTPLENLIPYGMTQAQISLCRALKIYSVEALYQLEGRNLKSLGVHANTLKPMVNKYMEAIRSGDAMAKRVAELEAKLAEMSKVIPADVKDEEVEAAIIEADRELLEAMTEDQLRAFIHEKSGAKPDGRLGHAALLNLAKGL